jgi:5-formyltetrahydrofolate cyclo-ligase
MEKIAAARTARHKNFLRGFHREQVLAIPAARRRALSRRAAMRLLSIPDFRFAETVGLYLPLPHEVDTAPILDICRRLKKAVAVPVVVPEEGALHFSFVPERTRWEPNVYGIPEPAERRVVDPRNLEILIVPGRAFTPEGFRLGTGAGYYDRFLAAHPDLAAVGLAFDEQVARRLPQAPFDVPLSAVVTPTRTFLCG